MTYDENGTLDSQYVDDEYEPEPNQAKVIITLTREDDGIDGFIDTREGLDFDPGNIPEYAGSDVLRLAAEMVLVAAGYNDHEVEHFLNTAPRGPVRIYEEGEEDA